MKLQMNEAPEIKVFDWHRMFYSNDVPVNYLFEIVFRTGFMFLFLVIFLKFLSKRGVKQLSVFELAILIALGSATGDPMFYSQVPIFYGLVVIIIVIAFYKLITWLTAKSERLEAILEGEPVCLLENGRINYPNYRKIGLPYDKFFAELRMRSVDHLGQVKKVYQETSGDLSIYLYPTGKIIPGLPIYPELLDRPMTEIPAEGDYACVHCGNVQRLLRTPEAKCKVCDHSQWLPSCSEEAVAPVSD